MTCVGLVDVSVYSSASLTVSHDGQPQCAKAVAYAAKALIRANTRYSLYFSQLPELKQVITPA